MSSSYYLKNLLADQAYLVRNQGDQYILLDGRCHPDYVERPLSAAGGKVCVRKPGTQSFPDEITKPRTGSQPVRGLPSNVPRRWLWAPAPDWETRVDYPGLAYAPDSLPPKRYSQVSRWQGPLNRVPDQPWLVDNGYLRQDVVYDGIGFGSANRRDRYDYLWNFDMPGAQKVNEPPIPRKYDVNDLTQKYPLWKEAAKAPDILDTQNTRRIV